MAKKSTRAAKSIKKDETKAERFIRVATPRISKAVKAISLIGHCAGSNYEYTPAQVKQIDAALSKVVVDVLNKFADKADKQSAFAFGE